jgi:hypothetical protein
MLPRELCATYVQKILFLTQKGHIKQSLSPITNNYFKLILLMSIFLNSFG